MILNRAGSNRCCSSKKPLKTPTRPIFDQFSSWHTTDCMQEHSYLVFASTLETKMSAAHLKPLGQSLVPPGHTSGLRVISIVSFLEAQISENHFSLDFQDQLQFSVLLEIVTVLLNPSSTTCQLVSWASGQIPSLSVGEDHPSCRANVEIVLSTVLDGQSI